jgi:hypothetical protein
LDWTDSPLEGLGGGSVMKIPEVLHDSNQHCKRNNYPIENHSDQGQFAELPLKTIGKSAKIWAIIVQFAVSNSETRLVIQFQHRFALDTLRTKTIVVRLGTIVLGN